MPTLTAVQRERDQMRDRSHAQQAWEARGQGRGVRGEGGEGSSNVLICTQGSKRKHMSSSMQELCATTHLLQALWLLCVPLQRMGGRGTHVTNSSVRCIVDTWRGFSTHPV